MIVHLQLYSILRDKLPAEANGRISLNLAMGTTILDILNKYDIHRKIVISVNGVHVTDKAHQLVDGDTVKLFSSISGG